MPEITEKPSAPTAAGELVDAIAQAIGQQPVASRDGWTLRLPEPAPPDLDADLCFALVDRPSANLCLRFDGALLRIDPRSGDPLDTVYGSARALLDFVENRQSSQALFLDGGWWLHDRAGRGAGDLDDLRDSIRALEAVLPAPYVLTPETRRRVRASADRLGAPFRVEHRSCPTPDAFVTDYVRTGRPVVLSDAVHGLDWWDFDRLRETFGAAHTHLSRYPNCSYAVADCLDRLVAGAPSAFKAALPVTSAIRRRYGLDDWFPAGSVFEKAQALLVAPADERMPASYRATSWHRDWADNLLAELIGRKRVRLVSPVDENRFALRTTPACHYNVAVDHSPLDPRDAAAIAGVHVADVVLDPGDVLFIPCGWLHTVENLTATAAINSWRVHPPELLAR